MAAFETFLVSVEVLEKMAQEEEEMRRSDWYIDECDMRKNIPNGWIALTDEAQRKIVRKYFDNNYMIEIALKQLRRAHNIYPNNPIFQNRLQVKYNRARKGELKEGNFLPEKPEYLQDLISNKVNIFIGSSMT